MTACRRVAWSSLERRSEVELTGQFERLLTSRHQAQHRLTNLAFLPKPTGTFTPTESIAVWWNGQLPCRCFLGSPREGTTASCWRTLLLLCRRRAAERQATRWGRARRADQPPVLRCSVLSHPGAFRQGEGHSHPRARRATRSRLCLVRWRQRGRPIPVPAPLGAGGSVENRALSGLDLQRGA